MTLFSCYYPVPDALFGEMISFFGGDNIKIPRLIILLCTAFLGDILRGREFLRRQAILIKFLGGFQQKNLLARSGVNNL